jgi:hypothetical protein
MTADAKATTSTLEGGCLCGTVRYRVEGAPKWAAHCHCRDCRRATGAPFVTYAGYPTAKVTWLGEKPVAFASSPGVTRRFCGRCGSPLAYEGHVYTAYQIPWVKLADGLPRVPMTPNDE